MLNLKTAGTAERGTGEGKGWRPIGGPRVPALGDVPGCSCMGGCHPETGCSQTPTCAWLSGGGAGPEKGSSGGKLGGGSEIGPRRPWGGPL